MVIFFLFNTSFFFFIYYFRLALNKRGIHDVIQNYDVMPYQLMN